MKEITVKELKEKMDSGETPVMIDVREPYEYEMSNIGALHIPLGTLPQKLGELEEYKNKEVVMICRSGARSANATNYLTQNGFPDVANLNGGMKAWAAEVDPTMDVA